MSYFRKVSVIRGRVLTPSGQGLRGVRVSNGLALREGFTLTRTDGYFDLLVTGGSSIKVKFGKTPFPYQSKYIFVPQNQVCTHRPFIINIFIMIWIIFFLDCCHGKCSFKNEQGKKWQSNGCQ